MLKLTSKRQGRKSEPLMPSASNSTVDSGLRFVVGFAVVMCVLIVPAKSANAAPPAQLWQKCPQGSAAGQCSQPGGVAVNSDTGDVYVVDRLNRRINVFSPWGVFLQSWGWGVADGSRELQSCGPEATPPTPNCLVGVPGAGAGQLAGSEGVSSKGIAADSTGAIYLYESKGCTGGIKCENSPHANRVQKFDSEGNFLLMFGGDVIANGAVGTGTLTAGSTAITAVTTSSRAFEVGQPIAGTGIAPETTIVSVGEGTIALSQPATASGVGVTISSPEGGGNVAENERQTVTVEPSASGGTFSLTFEVPNPSPSEATAAAVPFDASAAELEAKLEGLPNLGANVSVGGPAGGPWTIEFEGTRFANTDVEELVVSSSSLTPADSSVTVTSTNPAEVCSVASDCRGGAQGTGPGQFGEGSLNPSDLIDPMGSFIAVAPDDTVWVGGHGRIEVFDSGGQLLKSVSLPGEIVKALAIDPSGNIFIAYAQVGAPFASKDNVIKLSPAGSELCTATVKSPQALATDAAGRLYVAGSETANTDLTIHRFDPSCVEDLSYRFAVAGLVLFDFTMGIASGSACGVEGNLYYANASGTGTPNSFLRAYRPAPDPTICPPPAAAPSISSQYPRSVAATSAVVGADINPHFWPDATYYLQYGTEACGSTPSACEKAKLFPGVGLDAEDDVAEPSAGVALSGLQPDTTYHFRFVAESSGGGPVYGVDPDGDGPSEASPGEGLSGTFSTYPFPSDNDVACSNDAFRTGASASLPNCRAYELVSPVDKSGGDIITMGNPNNSNEPASLDQGAANGEGLTFSSYRAFGDPQGTPYTSQYLARRGVDGWSTEGISLPQQGPRLLENEILEASYKAFTEDLCSGWVMQAFEPALTPDALTGYANLYRRENCGVGVGALQAVTTVSPSLETSPGVLEPLAPAEFVPTVLGSSADGSHTIFAAHGKLSAEAAPCRPGEAQACPRQLYDFHEGTTSLVCVLPNGSPSPDECSAGTAPSSETLRNSVDHAISEDGSRIVWTTSATRKLYIRLNGGETRLISGQPAFFWGAAADGSKVFYTVLPSGATSHGALREYDVDAGKSAPIAEVLSVMGISEDAERVYVVSEEALTGEEENSEGQTAQLGQRNLYLREKDEEGDRTVFVARLTADDVEKTNGRSAVKSDPFYRSSRVSPDGLHAAFTSTAPLTGQDNVDSGSGKPATQVFLYEAETNQLRCVSCSPGGARPQLARKATVNGAPIDLWMAGSIPGWTYQTYPSRLLSEDGKRLFFESTEPLLLADTNGKRDVYEWQPGESQGDCERAGADLFLKREGGCLSLISTGQSPSDSAFVDASRDGRDVFIKTGESLLPQDPGLIDIYDVREGGGFPPPPAPRAPCEGQACQSPPVPPPAPTPASSAFTGPGDPKPTAGRKPRRCPQGKRRARGSKGKVRCVARKDKGGTRKRRAANVHRGGRR